MIGGFHFFGEMKSCDRKAKKRKCTVSEWKGARQGPGATACAPGVLWIGRYFPAGICPITGIRKEGMAGLSVDRVMKSAMTPGVCLVRDISSS